jgi:hypothetical protein
MDDEPKIFLSRILFLSKQEKEKGLLGKSNICRFYNKNELDSILVKTNNKTYYEHYINNKYIRLAIDYDNPNKLSLAKIKNIFINNFFNFISLYINIDYTIFKQGVAISRSNNNSTRLHVVYSNLIITLEDLIILMKIHFKKYFYNSEYLQYVDYSIYKKNFNLRLLYSPKENKQDQLIPILNKNIFNHLCTYYNKDRSYIINLS